MLSYYHNADTRPLNTYYSYKNIYLMREWGFNIHKIDIVVIQPLNGSNIQSLLRIAINVNLICRSMSQIYQTKALIIVV